MSIKQKASIQRKLLFSFVLLTLTLSLSIGVITHFITSKIIKDRVDKSFSLALDVIANSIDIEYSRILNLTNYIFVNDTIKQAIQTWGNDASDHLEVHHKAYLDLKQYFISHGLYDINNIAIFGLNGYQLYYYTNYNEREYFHLSDRFGDSQDSLLDCDETLVWEGPQTRYLGEQLLPSQEIRLFRTIKNENYSETIGYLYISLKPTVFSKYLSFSDAPYPGFFDETQLYLFYGNQLMAKSEHANPGAGDIQDLFEFSNGGLPDIKGKTRGNQVLYFKKLENPSWQVIGVLPKNFFLLNFAYIYLISISAFIVSIIVCSMLWYYFSSKLFKPLQQLSHTMMRISEGDGQLRSNIISEDEVGQLSRNFNEMLDRNALLYEKNLKREIEIQNAQYKALMSQINPHFLNNTLNTIRWMAIMSKADNIKKVIDALWTIIKHNYQSETKFVTVDKEIESAKEYLYLQKIAYPGKFNVSWQVSEESLLAICPKFFLQPIIENSIQHGILPKGDHGSIIINIGTQKNVLLIEVTDNGIGMAKGKIHELNKIFTAENKDYGNHGLSNVMYRMRLLYGNDVVFEIKSIPLQGTSIITEIPQTEALISL